MNPAPPRRGARLALACTIAWAAGCGRSQELEPCRIAERSCQEDIYYAVMRLRGDAFDPFVGLPEIRTLTVQQYRDELLGPTPAPSAGERPDAGALQPTAPPPETPPARPAVDPWDTSLQWLGLLKRGRPGRTEQVEDLTKYVQAFYTWSTARVTIVYDPKRTHPNDFDESATLAHEFVHAMQAGESDYGDSDGTTDGEFAAGALLEGEAKLYEALARLEMTHELSQTYGWNGFYDGDVAGHREELAGAGSRFYSTWIFRYSLGGDFIAQAWQRGGNAAVRDLVRRAPRSSLEYIALHEGFAIDEFAALECEPHPPAQSFELVTRDRFGALQLFAFLLGTGILNEPAWQTTFAFRDDRLFIYFDAEAQKVALSWRLRFADEATADQVAAAANTRPMLRASRLGRDVLIVGTDPDLADWPGAADCEADDSAL